MFQSINRLKLEIDRRALLKLGLVNDAGYYGGPYMAASSYRKERG
jgi:hypothetical protein